MKDEMKTEERIANQWVQANQRFAELASAENEPQKAKEILQASEMKYRLLVENAREQKVAIIPISGWASDPCVRLVPFAESFRGIRRKTYSETRAYLVQLIPPKSVCPATAFNTDDRQVTCR